MRATPKEIYWDQVLGSVQNIEKVNENFTKALIDTTKKASIPLYRQRRAIELEGRIIKLNSNRMTVEVQMQKQFIRITNKQLKEKKWLT